MYYNQGKWINKHEYGKWCYYNEYYDDELDLVTTDSLVQSCCNGESEAESHNDPIPHEMFFFFFQKKKNILVYLEKLLTFVNAFTVYKFCNNCIQVKENDSKSVGLFFKNSLSKWGTFEVQEVLLMKDFLFLVPISKETKMYAI